MANWYVDNVGGNDSNAGTSTGAAFASLNKFQSLATLVAGDVIYVKETGTDYTINDPATTYYFYNGTTNINFITLRGYTTNTARPKFIFNAITVTKYFGAINFRDINIQHNVSTFGVSIQLGVGQSSSPLTGSLLNSDITTNFTGTINNASQIFITFGFGNITNCIITGSTTQASYIFLATGYAILFTNCLFTDFFHGTSTSQNLIFNSSYSLNFNKCIFYNYGSSRNNYALFNAVQVTASNCVFIPGTTYSKTTNFAIFNTLGLTRAFSNILYNNSGTTHYLTNTAYSAGTATDMMPIGNNAMYNITYASYDTTTDPSNIMPYGVNNVITTNPFLSISPASSDFCKIDTSNSDAINYIIAKAFYDTGIDIGRYQTAASGGGATPNAYDLRAGVTVGSVTGTLNLPSINDVRSGTTFDNTTKTGLLDLPSVADVKLSVTFDQTTKTGTLESTDPGIANVLSGTNYKINSVSKTGTMISYALLAANLVKIGIDRGDGVTGTYVAAERYTDPGITNVKTGTSYLYNATTLNGSYTAYPLLALNLVKLGTDRGDGSLGTYDASERYTDLVLSNIKSSYSFRYNSLTDNRTGTHTEANSTDPGISNVRSGTNYTINDVSKTGTLDLPNESDVRFGTQFDGLTKTGDLDLPLQSKVDLGTIYDNGTKTGTLESTDPLESNVLAGVTYKIKSVSKTGTKPFYALLNAVDVKLGVDRGDGVTGTDIGADFNDDLTEDKVQLGLVYKNLNVSKTGTLTGGAADYPLEDKVLFPTSYAYGTKTGKLGTYNTSNLNIAEQINSNAKIIIANVLGNEFNELAYFKDVSKNDFYSSVKCFGIRPLKDIMTKEVIGKDTIDLEFEIKITDSFSNREGDDIERQIELDLIAKMEAIRRQLRITKFGNFNQIRIIKEYDRPEVEKLDNQDVLICSANIIISYSVN